MADLKSELAISEQTIEELNTQTKELEDQVNTDKDHLRRWKELHDDLQARNEMIQQAEQQTHVVLEGTQARVMTIHTDHIPSRQGRGSSCLRSQLQRRVDVWQVLEEGVKAHRTFWKHRGQWPTLFMEKVGLGVNKRKGREEVCLCPCLPQCGC